jgi:hypothetical protein
MCWGQHEQAAHEVEDGFIGRLLPRRVYLTPKLVEFLRPLDERVQILEMRLGTPMSHLLAHLSGRYKGKRIQHFRRAWKTVCLQAMLEGLDEGARKKRRATLLTDPNQGLLRMPRHNFRLTVVRSMLNRGVSERMVMKNSGH